MASIKYSFGNRNIKKCVRVDDMKTIMKDLEISGAENSRRKLVKRS